MPRLPRSVVTGLVALISSCALSAAPATKPAPDTDWREYLGDSGRSHYSPLAQVDRGNVTQLKVDRGRFLTDADIKHMNNVCVLAAEVANVLFPYEDPIGRRIYLVETQHQDYYEVVGVLKHRNATAAIGGSLRAGALGRSLRRIAIMCNSGVAGRGGATRRP